MSRLRRCGSEILVFGFFNRLLVRYLPEGALDPNFGSSGKVTTPIGNDEDLAYGMALQSDGRSSWPDRPVSAAGSGLRWSVTERTFNQR